MLDILPIKEKEAIKKLYKKSNIKKNMGYRKQKFFASVSKAVQKMQKNGELSWFSIPVYPVVSLSMGK